MHVFSSCQLLIITLEVFLGLESSCILCLYFCGQWHIVLINAFAFVLWHFWKYWIWQRVIFLHCIYFYIVPCINKSCVQNSSGAPPASYPMGTGGSFPGGKVAGAWSFLQYVFMVWCLFKHRDTCTFTFTFTFTFTYGHTLFGTVTWFQGTIWTSFPSTFFLSINKHKNASMVCNKVQVKDLI